MGYAPLTEESVVGYLRGTHVHHELFGGESDLVAKDLADGNVNLVFRVFSPSDPVRKSVIVKQALPFARAVGEQFKMPLDRTRLETEVLQLQAQYVPNLVPTIYHFDPEMHVVVMEDLNRHVVIREGFIKQNQYPRFADDMGVFLARTLFYTSDLYLDSGTKKSMVVRFTNPELCKVTEDLVFTHPFMQHPENKVNPLLTKQVESLRNNRTLIAKVNHFKMSFMTQTQALIHGDLHTGSVMANQEETKVIDPEFAFFGPMGFDLGALLGNIALNYAAQEHHIQDTAQRARYREWLLDTIRGVWSTFEREFVSLWTEYAVDWRNPEFQRGYMRRLLRDAAGFGGVKMLRRILGLAHVADLETIPDNRARAICESVALNIGYSWVMSSDFINSIDDLINLVKVTGPSL